MSATHNPQPGDRLIWHDPAPVYKGQPRMLHVVRVVDEPSSWGPGTERHWYVATGAYVTRGYLDSIPSTAEPCPLGSLPDDYRCTECGGWFHPGYWLGGRKYADRKLCLDDSHWFDAIAGVKSGERIVIDGGVYAIGPEPSSGQLRNHSAHYGFGGAEFRIRMPDGSERVTHNLWFNGPIPERWRARLPDNAGFVRGAA